MLLGGQRSSRTDLYFPEKAGLHIALFAVSFITVHEKYIPEYIPGILLLPDNCRPLQSGSGMNPGFHSRNVRDRSMRTFAEQLNPTVKMITVLILVILISFQYKTVLNLAVFCVSLALLCLGSRFSARTLLRILIPALIAAFGLFIMGLYYARGSSVTASELSDISTMPYAVRAAMSRNLDTALQLSTRLLAYAGLGIFFALTTRGEYFVRSLMHQCHMSPEFAYGMLAAFHLMPQMAREFRTVQLAFRVRGMNVSPLSFKVLFAMLVNSIHWSESLAMAMESKGFDGKAKRTWCEIPRVHVYDAAFAVLSIGAVIAGMLVL